MKILKRIGTSGHQGSGGSSVTPVGGNNQDQDNPTNATNFDELNGFDPSYADFVKETQQGVADFVNGHYVPPSAKGGNCPDGYLN